VGKVIHRRVVGSTVPAVPVWPGEPAGAAPLRP